MYNLNHDYSRHYDAMYERSENIGTHTCTTCHGDGVEEISDCCGAKMTYDAHSDMRCSDCLNECKIATDVCEDCNGSGELEKI